jgi:hypothetical protein
VLAVLEAAYLPASGARQDARSVVEDAVHRLPILVALQGRLGARIADTAVFSDVHNPEGAGHCCASRIGRWQR